MMTDDARTNDMAGLDAKRLAFDLIKQFEGCSLAPYRDAGGIWTIGWGNTFLGDGTPVTKDTPPLAQEQADILLDTGVENVARDITPLVTVPINPEQAAALISLAYNIGTGAFRNSTLLKKLNAGDYEGAATEFLQWNHCRGKVLPGLTRRREEEVALFRKSGHPRSGIMA